MLSTIIAPSNITKLTDSKVTTAIRMFSLFASLLFRFLSQKIKFLCIMSRSGDAAPIVTLASKVTPHILGWSESFLVELATTRPFILAAAKMIVHLLKQTENSAEAELQMMQNDTLELMHGTQRFSIPFKTEPFGQVIETCV